VTKPADNEVGRALANGSTNDYDPEEVFVRYTKLRIALAVRESVATAGQRTGDDVYTNVTLEERDDLNDTIESVTLHVGGDELTYGDPGADDLEYGDVRVRVENVTTNVYRDGRLLDNQTRNYTVTVGSRLFQMHNLTERYEAQLNTDMGDSAGLSRHLASRLYRVGWTRGWAQARGEPVPEVLPNRHVETLANDAMFATQRSVFGTTDPYAARQRTRAWGCTLSQDAHRIYDDPTGDSDDVDAVTGQVGDSSFCSGVDSTYSPIDADLSDSPTLDGLIGTRPYLEGRERITLEGTASATFGAMELQNAVDRAIDRVYEVDVRADVSGYEETVIPANEETADRLRVEAFGVQSVTSERVLDTDGNGRDRAYYRFRIQFHATYATEDGDSALVKYVMNVTVAGEHSPRAKTDGRGIDDDYVVGNGGEDDVLSGRNYVGTPDAAVEAVFSGVDDASNAEAQIADHLANNGDRVFDRRSLYNVLTESGGTVTIDRTPGEDQVERIRGWVIRDLRGLNETAASVSISPRRHELLRPESPLRNVRAQIDDDGQWVYTHLDDRYYANAPDKVRAEARFYYMRELRNRVDRAIATHEARVDAINSSIGSHANATIGNTVGFTRDQLSGDTYRQPPDVTAPDLLDGSTLEPVASPTYLTVDRVDVSEVPAAGDPEYDFVPLTIRQTVDYAAPSRDRDDTSTVDIQTAGEVLRAAKATTPVTDDADWARRVERYNDSLDAEIYGITTRTARTAAGRFDSVSEARLRAELAAELDALGPVERQAILLGEGGPVLDAVARNVSESFEPPDDPGQRYGRDDFQAHLASTIRTGLDAEVANWRPARRTVVRTQAIGSQVRDDVTASTASATERRLATAASDSLSNTSVTGPGERWLESDRGAQEYAPASVASGRSTIRRPNWNLQTTNVWNVTLRGEYARFTLRSTSGSPAADGMTEYVREDGPVNVSIDGYGTVTVGYSEAITFESRVSMVVAVPPDSLGVGDRTSTAAECSDTYPRTGAIESDGGFDSCAGTEHRHRHRFESVHTPRSGAVRASEAGPGPVVPGREQPPHTV